MLDAGTIAFIRCRHFVIFPRCGQLNLFMFDEIGLQSELTHSEIQRGREISLTRHSAGASVRLGFNKHISEDA